MITTTVQLAHNLIRLSNFDDADRPIFNGILAAHAPITATACESFVGLLCKAFGIAEPSLASLGVIYTVSTRAILHGVAYDPTFTLERFQSQFLFAYVPTPSERARFIGDHIARFRRAMIFTTEVRVGMPIGSSVTMADVDALMRAAICQELLDIHALFVRVADSVFRVENIDPTELVATRRSSIDLVV